MKEAASLKEKFTQEIDVADWSMLKDHFERGALVSVSTSLDLVEVAIAVAEDQVEQVKAWMASGQVKNITSEEVEAWRENPQQKVAEFLIVQPYVLIQALENLAD